MFLTYTNPQTLKGSNKGGQNRHSVTHEKRLLWLMIDEAPQQIIAFTYGSSLGLPATTPYPVETLGPQVYDLIRIKDITRPQESINLTIVLVH